MKRPIKYSLQALLVVMSLFVLTSQSVAEHRERTLVRRVPPIMTDESGNSARQLDLATFLLDVKVMGVLARTTMTMTFYNPGSRAVAGNLYVPLPVDATISGYALDVNGVMVDGVPVERDTARQVYQTVVARGIDPGLVEWTRGNVFKTRVFPVPAKGSRTVSLSYLSTVVTAVATSDSPAKKPRLIIPFDFKKPIADFKLSLEVVKPMVKPLVISASWNKLEFLAWRDGFRSEFSAKNFTPDSDCEIELPTVDERSVLLEKNNQAEVNGGKGAWFLWTSPRAALGQSLGISAQPSPAKELSLYWDASLSRQNARHDLIIKTLAIWLVEQAKTPASSVEKVHLTVFRESAEATRSYPVNRGLSPDLLRDLAALSYDGGTRSGYLPSPPKASQMVILVSDGFYTIGQKAFPDFSQPVYCLASEARLDSSRLQSIANANGGSLVIVKDPLEAAKQLGRASFRLISATVSEGKVSAIESIADSSNDLSGVTGLLESQTAKLSLSYGFGTVVSKKIELELRLDQAVDAYVDGGAYQDVRGSLGIFWAQNKLLRLMAGSDSQTEARKADMRELGLQWNLVSPGTSLLVLESLAQYLEFKIAPPLSLAAMRSEYFQAMEDQSKEKRVTSEAHQDQVFAWWQERLTWHKTKFDYPANYRAAQINKKSAESGAADVMHSPASGLSQQTQDIAAERSVAGQPTKGAAEESGPAVSIQAWQPDTPYLRSLLKLVGEDSDFATGSDNKAKPRALTPVLAQKAYQHYLDLRKSYLTSPSFFFDVGDFFEARAASSYAIRIWSVLTEMDLEAPGLLRIVAYRLTQTGQHQLAREIFEQVLAMRPEEPQSWRDLALVLDALKQHERAVDLLWHVVSNEWSMTPQIEVICLMEMNAALVRAKAAGQKHSATIPARFVQALDTDIRIVLTWDTNLSDMDLWVIEPSGEKAFYGNQRTHIGGLVSQDITTGYGPEEYLLKKGMRGDYTVMVNYYGNQNPEVSGTVTLQAEIITNFARPNEKRQALTLSLQGDGSSYTVGKVAW